MMDEASIADTVQNRLAAWGIPICNAGGIRDASTDASSADVGSAGVPPTDVASTGVPPIDVSSADDVASRTRYQKPFHLGVFGGTFDPIHLGHLSLAEQARCACNFDAVLFIPAGKPVFKRDRVITDARHRLAMCEIACRANSFFAVSSIEVDRPGSTYTIDTLRALRALVPSWVSLSLIVGTDALSSVSHWRSVEEISALADFIEVVRPSSNQHKDEFPVCDSAEQPTCHLRVHTVQAPELDISSSAIRAMIFHNRSVRYLVPEAVYDYIIDHQLYR